MAKQITLNDLPEFVGETIDIFEDFLEEKGVKLDNPEIEEAVADGQDPESCAIIYGTDYGDLQDELTALFRAWGLVEEEKGNRIKTVILREVSDPKVIYGILLAETEEPVSEVVSKFLLAKADVAKTNDEWQIADIVELLPKEWNARVCEETSVFI